MSRQRNMEDQAALPRGRNAPAISELTPCALIRKRSRRDRGRCRRGVGPRRRAARRSTAADRRRHRASTSLAGSDRSRRCRRRAVTTSVRAASSAVGRARPRGRGFAYSRWRKLRRTIGRAAPACLLCRAARAAPRGGDGAMRDRRRHSVGPAAGRQQSGFAEARDVHQRRIALPRRGGGKLLGRAPQREDRFDLAAQQAGVGQRRQRGARQHDGATVMRVALFGEYGRVEAVMQRQRAAGEQPRHQREGDAGERAERDRRQDSRVLARGRLRRNTASPPAISSLWLRATGTRPSPVTSKVMAATWAAAWPGRADGWKNSAARRSNTSSSGTTPSGRSRPKPQMWRIGNSSAATCMAISAMRDRADARRCDDRLGADARQARPPSPARARAAAAAPRSCRRAARRAAR